MHESALLPLADREQIDRLRLIRSEHVGCVTFHRLLQRYGSASAALQALPDLARRGGHRGRVRVCGRDQAEAEIAATIACGAHLIVFGDVDYPPLLASIEDPPATIAVIGNPDLLVRPSIGVVGSRNASLAALGFAREIARDLGAAGYVVISGLARGIDAQAHCGALASGTVAVLASGVDVCYPQGNAALYEEVTRHGAMISEAPVGTQAQARNFPRRNRLISGLSLGVVVVEATLRSGSLITARLAAEQGREVFAVPGSPLDARARGCNDLIRQGAILTESAADVLAVLPRIAVTGRAAAGRPTGPGALPLPELAAPERANHTDIDDAARKAVAESLSPTPVAVDEIIRTCQLSAPQVSTILLEWELAGRLERHPGNRVSLTC